MTKVRIIKNWDGDNITRQTPESKGVWKNIHFSLSETKNIDYVFVINQVKEKIILNCNPQNIYYINLEAHDYYPEWIKKIPKIYSRLYLYSEKIQDERVRILRGGIVWRVNKTFDELVEQVIPRKTENLSWITSNKIKLYGHKKRMKFLQRIKNKVYFDLYGNGFQSINCKSTGLSKYVYSLAIENYSGKNYFSEKIADCFLNWTMPIYYGCTNITDFFPKKSYEPININNPEVIKKINKIKSNNPSEISLVDIKKARDLVLHKYQLIPTLADIIESNHKSEATYKNMTLKPMGVKSSVIRKTKMMLSNYKNKINKNSTRI